MRLTCKLAIQFAIVYPLLTSISSFAADSGKLISRIEITSGDYASKIAVELATRRKDASSDIAIAVNVDSTQLAEQATTIELPEGGTAQLKRTRHEARPAVTSWTGRTDDGSIQLILAIERGKAYGQLNKDGSLYLIQPSQDGRYSIITKNKSDPSLKDHASPERPTPPKSLEESEREYQQQRGKNKTTKTTPDRAQTLGFGDPIIDVMIVVAPVAQPQFSSVSSGTILVESINTALINSSIAATARLVDIFPLPAFQSEGVTIGDQLDAIADNATVQRRRTAVGADVVMLISKRKNTDDSCGRGYLGPDPIRPYAAVSFDCLSIYTFIHEFGHLLGADHSWDDQPYDQGYAHGWPSFRDSYLSTNGFGACFFTIMGGQKVAEYLQCGGSRILYFSSPNINYSYSYFGTWRIGDSRWADNARRIRETAGIVSNGRDTTSEGNQVNTKIKVVNAVNSVLRWWLSAD